MYKLDRIKQIFVEKSLYESDLVNRIKQNKSEKTELIEIENISDISGLLAPDLDIFDKQNLVISRFQGKFLSSCPGSDGMVCCRYFVINTGPGCLYDCHYCFLQSFLNTPYMHIYGNLEDMISELDKKISSLNFHTRIGTGEYSDSLALERLTGISAGMVEYFAKKKNVTLELKTKSNQVHTLLDLDHGGNTVIAWSLNPPGLISEIEEGTANLTERLEAAVLAVKAGYRVAFHFDPMIYFPGWEKEYHAVIDLLAENIDPWKISWISLGSFRYSPGLKEIIQKRFVDDNLTRTEMLNGPDGKFRYLKNKRAEMYRSMKKKIHGFHPDLFTYMCMETKNTWETLETAVPDSAKNLDGQFENRRIKMLDIATGKK